MKSFRITNSRLPIDSEEYFVNSIPEYNGQIYGYSYPAPYERNDLYLKLINQQDARNPESNLEPESGMLLYADFDFEYNYYAEGYERGTASPLIVLNQIVAPSLNVWLLNEASEVSLQNDDQSDDMQLNSNYKEAYDAMFEYDDMGAQLISLDYFNNYFGDVADSVGVIENFPSQGIPGFEKPQFVNKQVQSIYTDPQNKRENFPMFSKFKLTGVQKTQFCTILEESNLEHQFIDFLEMHREHNTQSADFITSDNEESVSKTVHAYTYEKFLTHLDAGHGGSTTDGISNEESVCEYFENFIKGMLARNRIQNFIENSSYGSLFPVAFRLEIETRYLGNKKTFYFFNYDDLLEFKHYHSEILYGMIYDCRVTVINGFVTTKADFTSDKHLIFVESPYYEEYIYAIDSPPIPPDVELVTYRGVDNKVLILFNQMVDKRALVPIVVNESDQSDTIEIQYLAQHITPPNPIIYESDDPVDFELFKTTEHPVEYSDFANEHYRLIRSGTPKLTSAAYEDTIVPNQVYYYMFRTQDVHGYVSNPSPIYEFVLIKEGETLYPRIRIVDLAKPEPPVQKNRTFKKYLKIGFSPRQYQIPSDEIQNINDSLINGDVPIGISEDNIIGSDRTFKFRIRSKNTGKLIDINVTFKKNKVIKA